MGVESLGELVRMLESERMEESNYARARLAALGAEAAPAVPLLAELAKSQNLLFRQRAVEALIELGEIAAPAVPALVPLLIGYVDDYVRKKAVEALEGIGEKAVPALTAELRNPDKWVQANAAYGLGIIGEKAVNAAPLLIERIEDPDSLVSMHAVQSLGRMNAQSAIPSLISALKSPGFRDKDTVVVALGALAAEDAAPELVRLLKCPNFFTRMHAVQALGRIKVERLKKERAVPALIEALKDREPKVRAYSARALGEIRAEEAVPELWRLASNSIMFSDSDAEVRGEAARAIWRMTGPALVKEWKENPGSRREIGVKIRMLHEHMKKIDFSKDLGMIEKHRLEPPGREGAFKRALAFPRPNQPVTRRKPASLQKLASRPGA